MTAEDRAALPLPTGTVTFLFSDIQGSTRLLRELGDAYVPVLAEHRRALRSAFAAHHGVEIGTEGDSFFIAFARASDAVAAAAEGQQRLEGGPVRVRMGLHTGEPLLTAEGYVGLVVHRAARIAAVAHGGQVLLSEAVAMLVGDCLPLDVGLRDLGSVRLKDLTKAEHVYQILHPELQDCFPSLRSLEATPNNLPQQLTSFVGREQAMADLERLLVKSRIVTLSGAGGAGKTRLSLQLAAAALDGFPDGAWLVELAPVVSPNLVTHTVANVLGLREEAGTPVIQTVVDHLKDRRLLLLLDNCEHLLAACAAFVDTVVRQCPEVTILATSREALGIQGEQTYRVPSLSVPDRRQTPTLQSLSTYASVRLFIDRALAVRSDFQATNQNAPALASLCCHLDGIPLAIELAAARVRSLSVEEIDRKLDERFRLLTGGSKTALPRQQTLRALIDWSYDLLTGSEKTLLRRLSVFAGGWALAAAEVVCASDDIRPEEILDLLTSLTDKSLVMAEQNTGLTRYDMLETVREYAKQVLVDSGDQRGVGERHRDFFLALAEEARLKLNGPEQSTWLQRLEDEHENLRGGFEWSYKDGTWGEALRLCTALRRFWTIRGHFSEGRNWCARALGKPAGEEPSQERAKTLDTAGELAYFQCDYLVAQAYFEESLAISRKLGNRRDIARSLSMLGNVAFEQGDYGEAGKFHQEGLVISRELGDQSLIGWSLRSLGEIASSQGRIAPARALLEEGLSIEKSSGNLGGMAAALGILGSLSFFQGDYVASRNLHEQSLAMGRQIGDRIGTATSLANLGHGAIEMQDYPSACTLLEQSLAIQRELGDWQGIARSLEGLATVISVRGRFGHAARVWGAAARLREEFRSPIPGLERPIHDKRLDAARAAFGDEAVFDQAWQGGRALALEQAISLALEEALTAPVPDHC